MVFLLFFIVNFWNSITSQKYIPLKLLFLNDGHVVHLIFFLFQLLSNTTCIYSMCFLFTIYFSYYLSRFLLFIIWFLFCEIHWNNWISCIRLTGWRSKTQLPLPLPLNLKKKKHIEKNNIKFFIYIKIQSI